MTCSTRKYTYENYGNISKDLISIAPLFMDVYAVQCTVYTRTQSWLCTCRRLILGHHVVKSVIQLHSDFLDLQLLA